MQVDLAEQIETLLIAIRGSPLEQVTLQQAAFRRWHDRIDRLHSFFQTYGLTTRMRGYLQVLTGERIGHVSLYQMRLFYYWYECCINLEATPLNRQ